MRKIRKILDLAFIGLFYVISAVVGIAVAATFHPKGAPVTTLTCLIGFVGYVLTGWVLMGVGYYLGVVKMADGLQTPKDLLHLELSDEPVPGPRDLVAQENLSAAQADTSSLNLTPKVTRPGVCPSSWRAAFKDGFSYQEWQASRGMSVAK